jgi:hypothetical protein
MKIISLIIGTFISFISLAQTYSRVQIFITDSELPSLYSIGLDLDHIEYRRNYYIQAELNEHDIQKLDQNGFDYQIIVADLETFYAKQLSAPIHKTGAFPCNNGNNEPVYTTPINFELGSMGGYLTYDEYLENLDSMFSKYPNLITTKSPISTFLTEENRPIYHVRISDNPGTDEGEEQVLYSAIHHAREPASLSQTIYYMWYLLENYATDTEVQYLVDNTDMFFVPMLNPDGYIYNETTNPTGGGLWRKNRRNNGGGIYGVDLNRNYDYQWGVSGTSTNPNDNTYCGPSAFSEPETQAMKWLCENNNFKFAFNAHTHGDLVLFPFGYATNTFTSDHNYYTEITDHMVQYSGYTNQVSSELYPAAGDSDDWMYDGDLGVKPKVFAMTPEIGSDAGGFWPSSLEVDGICKDMVYPNMRLAHLPHVYGEITDMEDELWSLHNDYINFDVTRFGLTAGDFTVSISPIQGFTSVGNPKVISGMQILDIETDSIAYSLLPTISSGDDIIYVLNLDNGSIIIRDTIMKQYGNPSQVFSDPGNDLGNWTSNDWNTTTEDFVSPSTSITDSPNQNYSNFANNEIVSTPTFNLTNSTQAFVSFWAKWDIENNYDYVQFDVSSDNGISWTPMCGNYTNLGNSNQANNEPLYDGTQSSWVKEEISLNDFLGEQILFRFTLNADIGVTGDGFYFDDFQVYQDNTLHADNYIYHFSIYPNPTSDVFYINHNYNEKMNYRLTSLNGSIIQDFEKLNIGTTIIDMNNLVEGMYFLSIYTNNGVVSTQKIIKN